uniref:Uncharacterized protein n=1 Tax=Rhabditophanes sp. KR3021 TaxID=114890 RepID=A0AC35TJR8_9BILA
MHGNFLRMRRLLGMLVFILSQTSVYGCFEDGEKAMEIKVLLKIGGNDTALFMNPFAIALIGNGIESTGPVVLFTGHIHASTFRLPRNNVRTFSMSIPKSSRTPFKESNDGKEEGPGLLFILFIIFFILAAVLILVVIGVYGPYLLGSRTSPTKPSTLNLMKNKDGEAESEGDN